MKLVDITGRMFGRLTVVSRDASRHNEAQWKCLCDCGAVVVVPGSRLRKGHTRSCGCWMPALISISRTTHGMTRSPEYNSWKSLVSRCCNPNDPYYSEYGARGVSVCERWRDSFYCFLQDMGHRPSGQHTIDRIDNDGNYEPTNCRWATRVEQGCNKRNNKMLTFNGKTLCAAEWSRVTGIPASRIYSRIRLGWSDAKILNTPLSGGRKAAQ